MILKIQCPKCGQTIEVTKNSKLITCEHCQSDIIIAEKNQTIDIICPKCKTPAQVKSNTKLITCEHCGEDIKIDNIHIVDFRTDNFQFDIPLKDETVNDPKIPPKDKKVLIEQLKAIKEHIKDVPKIGDSINENLIAIEQSKHNPVRMIFNFISIVGLFFIGVISLLFDISWFFIIALLFVVVINLLGNNGNENKRKAAEQKVKEGEKKIKRIQETSPYKFVSPELSYRVSAIEGIIEILENNRADDFQTAQNLYIQEKLTKDNIQASRDAQKAAEDAKYWAIMSPEVIKQKTK